MPAVITADLRLNEPRFLSLPNIMKAKQKPFIQINLAELDVAVHQSLNIIHIAAPPKRKGGVIVADVAALVDKLHNEAQVL